MGHDSRVHLCSSVLVSEVQALKAEVEILKSALKGEVQDRITGDALNGEACMQLQVLMDGGDWKSERKLSEEVSDLRLALEAEVLVRLQADEKLEREMQPLMAISADTIRSLRMEIEQEARQRKSEFESLRNSVTVTSSREKWSIHSKNVSGNEDTLEKERLERQAEDRSLHQLINTLADQTNLALEEESARLWEAVKTHNHDVIIDGGTGSRQLGILANNMQIQTFSKQDSSQQPRKVQLYGQTFAAPVASFGASTLATSSPPMHNVPIGSTHTLSNAGNTDGKRGALP